MAGTTLTPEVRESAYAKSPGFVGEAVRGRDVPRANGRFIVSGGFPISGLEVSLTEEPEGLFDGLRSILQTKGFAGSLHKIQPTLGAMKWVFRRAQTYAPKT